MTRKLPSRFSQWAQPGMGVGHLPVLTEVLGNILPLSQVQGCILVQKKQSQNREHHLSLAETHSSHQSFLPLNAERALTVSFPTSRTWNPSTPSCNQELRASYRDKRPDERSTYKQDLYLQKTQFSLLVSKVSPSCPTHAFTV